MGRQTGFSQSLWAFGGLILASAFVMACNAPTAPRNNAESSAMKTAGGETVQKVEVDPQKAVDPVCGMTVENGITATYHGKTYEFCSEYCAEAFKKNPEKYVPQSAD